MAPKSCVYGVMTLLLICSGCRRSNQSVCSVPSSAAVLLDEKRLTDVSLPVGVQAYDITKKVEQGQQKKYTLATTFETSLAYAMLVEFYQNDMERLGWKQVVEIPLDNGIFFTFETPRKLCSICIEDQGDMRRVTIFIATRA